MELLQTNCKIKCEMGACAGAAAYTVKFNRVGIGSRIHVCEKCLNELYALIGERVIPHSIETGRKRPK